MKERPILFSAPMVRALLDGGKTQTRRVIKPQPVRVADSTILQWRGGLFQPERLPKNSNMLAHCPHGQPGDQLWVRETWAVSSIYNGIPPRAIHPGAGVLYAATHERSGIKDRPSIHMPRWASRINLEITGVRVERLQDISDQDAIAEGIRRAGPGWERWHPDPDDTEHTGSTQKPRLSYRGLWESINGTNSWDVNPWVWVIEFRRVA